MCNRRPLGPRGALRVLVIEDEARMRQLLIDVLPGMGYEAVAVRLAEEALTRMRQQPADIVILDLNLPVMDGMTFLDQFRRQWPQTPVIIMTGFGDLDAAKRAIRHGVVDFLTKPCHLGEIEQALGRARRLVDRPAPVAGEAQECTELSPRGPEPQPADSAVVIPVPSTLPDALRRLIEAAVQRHNGNRSAAAAELGISRRTLYNHLSK